MNAKLNGPLSVGLRVLAASLFLMAAVIFAETRGSTSVTGAYPAVNTPTPSHVQYSYFIDLPSVVNNLPPVSSQSYYVQDLTITVTYNLGYALGQQDYNSGSTQDHLVILDFGYPVYTNTMPVPTVGTYLVFESPRVFHPTSDIRQAVTQFAKGYFYGTKTNLSSHPRIVVSTNNCCGGVDVSVYQGHGTGWASMMTDIAASISNYSSQVDAVAGSDMEMAFPGAATDPWATRQWVAYFMAGTVSFPCNTATQGKDQGCLYDFGTASVAADGTPCAGALGAQWHACDVWTISWGATKSGTNAPFARALPEIYHTSGSDSSAWRNLDANSISASWNTPHYGAMYFVGSLTQYAMCGSSCSDGNGGYYANNSPTQGYQMLYDALNSNSTTAQQIPSSTDIGKQFP